jgi:hypothetical protein
VVFEGALWQRNDLPSLANPLLVVRDPIAIYFKSLLIRDYISNPM